MEEGKSVVAESEARPSGDVDLRYYNELAGSVPHELASVPLLVHCMVEQVVATEEGRDPPSETLKPRREDGLDDNLAAHISALAYKLGLSDEERDVCCLTITAHHISYSVAKGHTLLTVLGPSSFSTRR